MKITQNKLQQIIAEEFQRLLQENPVRTASPEEIFGVPDPTAGGEGAPAQDPAAAAREKLLIDHFNTKFAVLKPKLMAIAELARQKAGFAEELPWLIETSVTSGRQGAVLRLDIALEKMH